jgi:hypothetical protein
MFELTAVHFGHVFVEIDLCVEGFGTQITGYHLVRMGFQMRCKSKMNETNIKTEFLS